MANWPGMDFTPHKAAILLDWYDAMGVSEAIATTPADWFADVPAPKAAAGAGRAAGGACRPAVQGTQATAAGGRRAAHQASCRRSPRRGRDGRA